MKNIELTEEQNMKLIEMCNTLFPEHKWGWGSDLAEQNMIDCDIHLSGEDFKLFHWFEFCMTHLAEKIIATFELTQDKERVYKRTFNEELSKFYLQSLEYSRDYKKSHPIDYLYEAFKKLK
jgi:hypothetical protein